MQDAGRGARTVWLTALAVGIAALLYSSILLFAARVSAQAPTRQGNGHWVVAPGNPGENLPLAGVSLFDSLFAVQDPNGRWVYRLPFPFAALIRQAEAKSGCARQACSRKVLIPIGRSLQRTGAAPEFFRYPRAVIAFDRQALPAGPASNAAAPLLLKDRLYLGYQEKTQTIEVISYNEKAGRFEFQLVHDYSAQGKPSVSYANRSVCTSCHQNGAPIFSRPQWDETSANPHVAARLRAEHRDFYGIALGHGVDIPDAINAAVLRANRFALYQKLWREACGAETDPAARPCRAALFKAALQLRLSEGAGYDRKLAFFVRPSFIKNGQRLWPQGLAVPEANIPNRILDKRATQQDTVLSLRDAHIAAPFEALAPRGPSEIVDVSALETIDRLVEGVAEFLNETEVQRLAAFLAARKNADDRRERVVPCRADDRDAHIDFACEEPNAYVEGRLYRRGAGGPERVRFDKIILDDAHMRPGVVWQDLRRVRGAGSDRIRMVEYRYSQDTRHLQGGRRLSDGRAVTGFALRVVAQETQGAQHALDGSLRLSLRDDFAPIEQAVERMVRTPQAGDMLSARPLRGGALMRALFAQLGLSTSTDAAYGARDYDARQLAGMVETDRRNVSPTPLHAYCASCHGGRDTFPPNFLHGDAQRVQRRLQACAARIYYRLSMWDVPLAQRGKVPMPPEPSLAKFDLDALHWTRHADRLALLRYVAKYLPAGRSPQSIVDSDYESLPVCVEATH